MIIEKCNKLDRKIHDDLFLNNYLSKQDDHKRAFTSLDVIEDCQIAIDEYKKIDEKNFQDRSTLYIYGVLQSLYCQQDGITQLYKTIINSSIKNIYDLFKLYKSNENIREVRNDIAGHPVSKNSGNKFYYIAKGSNSKYRFTYAGFSPEFKTVNVDLKVFIKEQEEFISQILKDVDSEIENKIKSHKEKYKDMKLINFVNNLNKSLSDLGGAITSTNPHAFIGLSQIKENIKNLKVNLNNRYNNEIPESVSYIFRLVDHILEEFGRWVENDLLSNNLDAEVFLDSLYNQIDELEKILIEIDLEFEN